MLRSPVVCLFAAGDPRERHPLEKGVHMDIASETTILRGTKTSLGGRRPKTNLDARFCAEDGCPTRLSRYNTRPYCYAHGTIRFPRTRGRVAE